MRTFNHPMAIASGETSIIEHVFDISLLLYFCAFLVFNNDEIDITQSDSLIRNCSTLLLFFSGLCLFKNNVKVLRSKYLYIKSYSWFVLFGIISALWAEDVQHVYALIPTFIRILFLAVFLPLRIKDESGFIAIFNVFIISILFKVIVIGSMMYMLYGDEMITHRFGMNFGYNPNDSAVMCLFAIAFLFYYIIEGKNSLLKSLNVVIILFFIIVIFLTQSKKGILGVVSFLALYVFFQKKSLKKFIPVFFVFLVLTLIIIHSGLFEELSEGAFGRLESFWGGESSKDDSTLMREKLVSKAINIWMDNPIFGIGLNNFALHSGVSKDYYSHNNYVEILSGIGLVGFVLYYIPILCCLSSIKNIRKFPIMALIKSLVIIILFLDVGNVSYQAFHIQVIYIMLFICLYNSKMLKRSKVINLCS